MPHPTNVEGNSILSTPSYVPPWFGAEQDKLRACTSLVTRLTDEIHSCGDWLSPTAEEHERRLYFVQCLKQRLKRIYPWCELVTFGSLLTGLYLPDGEIDVALIWLYGHPAQGQHNPYSRISTLLADIWPIFKWHYFFGDTGQVPERTAHAHAKVTRSQRQFERQTRISTASVGRAAAWISSQMAARPYLKAFILVVKAWATRNELHSVWNGCLNSYCLTVMVVSFFQLHPRVGHKTSDIHRHLGKLLLSLFAYYGCADTEAISFDYRLGISVRGKGELFDPAERGWALPDTLGLYVEDPSDKDNNLGASMFDLAKIRNAFYAAYERLEEAIYETKQGSRHGSILNAILGYDQEASPFPYQNAEKS